MKPLRSSFLLLCLVPLALGACASDKKPPRLCPQVAILRELERYSDYGNDLPEASTLVSVASMKSVEGGCEYGDKGVDIKFALNMLAQKGPRLGGDKIGLPFFVSLLDPDDKVVSKELMTADFTFPSGGKITEKAEPLHVFIPLAKDGDASNYRVLLGFQLTEEQLKIRRQEAERKAAEEK